MRYLKVAGVVWALIYFAMGIWSLPLESIDLAGDIDFWNTVIFLFATQLLPLPIVLVAIWFPRNAGKALLLCVAASITGSVVAVLFGSPSSFASNIADAGPFLAIIAMYNIPNLAFGIAYIRAGRVPMDADPSGEGPSIRES